MSSFSIKATIMTNLVRPGAGEGEELGGGGGGGGY